MRLRLNVLLACLLCVYLHAPLIVALDLRPTVSPWLEDGTNTYLRVQRNVCVGIGPTATDALSVCTAPVASATRALVNLSNTALSGGSANGTYLGANPAACTGNFLDVQVAGAARAKLSCAGELTALSATFTTSIATPLILGGAASVGITSSTSRVAIIKGASVSQTTLIQFQDSVASKFSIGYNVPVSDSFIIFDDQNSAYRMVINNAGNTGLGTTTPNEGLEMGATLNIRIPNIKSVTGNRYVCIDTNGTLISQAAVCVGT